MTVERVSKPGEYRGYNQASYDSYARASQYVVMRDGVKIAIDRYWPTAGGTPAEGPLPTIFITHRYMRSYERPDGTLVSSPDEFHAYKFMVCNGYAVVAWDPRGGGASFGEYHGLLSVEEIQDAVEMIGWIAEQDWSDGNVGMIGRSYMGQMQHLMASYYPPALKAIFPSVCIFDSFDGVFPGGVRRPWVTDKMPILLSSDFGEDAAGRGVPARVDEDPDGVLRDEALKQHKEGEQHLLNMFEHWVGAAKAGKSYRDGEYYAGEQYFLEPDPKTSGVNPATRLGPIREGNIPSYMFGGWYDSFSYDTAAWYMNRESSHKLIFGPWGHAEGVSELAFEESRRFEGTEALRWMDYWLKGIDNGIVDEAPVHYAISSAEDKWVWESTEQWPPKESVSQDFFLVNGGNKLGGLADSVPGADDKVDARIQFDRTATTSQGSRWYGAMGMPVAYPDMAENDQKGLVYETPPLTQEVSIAGSPVVELYVSSTAKDADFLVHLHDVDENGFSRHLVEGVLRASHREEGEAPYNAPGGVYHPSTRAAVENAAPLNPGLAKLRIALLPIAAKFQGGHKIRLVIHGADIDNLDTLAQEPEPTVTIASTADAPSKLVLPVLSL